MLVAALQQAPIDTEYIKSLNPDASEEDKRNSLDYGLRIGNATLLRILCPNGIDINTADYAGQTLSHKAVQSKPSFIKKLLELGADLKSRDYQYRTAMDLASRKKH